MNFIDVLPPSSPEAERTALGCVLLDPKHGPELLGRLRVDDFYDTRHRCIFLTLLAMSREGALLDPVALDIRLRNTARVEESGGQSYVSEVAHAAPSLGIFDTVLEELRDKARRRQILSVAARVRSLALDSSVRSDELSDAVAAMAADTSATPEAKPYLRFWTPGELQKYEIPPEAILVGDKHIMRGGVVVIGGAPGIGKSRAATALAVAGATGESWFGLPVRRKFRTLILQNENGLHRLKDEFAAMESGALEEWVRVSEPPAFGMAFSDQEFRRQLVREINAFRPDVIIFDPWNSLAADDSQRDYKAAFDVLRSIAGQGLTGAALVVVAHTRKPKDTDRKSGRSLLHELSGAHLLGSVPRCVFIMQAGSDDGDDDRVVWQCAKNNDGDMGKRSAWHRCNGGFIPSDGFDWEAFDGAGGQPRKDCITRETVRSLFVDDDGRARTILKRIAVEELMERTGKGKSACYESLGSGGRFAVHLQEDREGFLSWKE